MTGFKGRSGKSFRARLALQQTEDGKWRVEFDEPWAKEGAKPPEAPEGAEPPGADRRGAARSGLAAPPSDEPRGRPVGGARHYRSRMPLTLVLGPANSAKAGEVLGAYAPAAQRGALLVVPTAPDAAHYARELAAAGAVLGSVLTFRGLAREIARRAGYGGRRLSALQRERVLQPGGRAGPLPGAGATPRRRRASRPRPAT